MRYDAGARFRINTVGGTVLLDDTRIKGVLGKGFERITGELSGTWLDLGANSVSGSISVMRREKVGTPADAAGASHGDAASSSGQSGSAQSGSAPSGDEASA